MVSTSTPLRVGIIGANVDYGWGSRAHIPALMKLPEFTLAAVCTTRAETAAAQLAAWECIDTVLGVGVEEGEAPAHLLALMDERTEARKAKDFTRADAIRDELTAEGWTIEDTPKGPRLKSL